MIFIGTEAMHHQRRRQLRLPNGTDYFKGEYLQTPEDPRFSPQAFLIEQPPNSTILSHFHRQNQFQVIIGGSGSIGRHPLRPLTVHYAGAYTGYGPLVSGADGLIYFTMRFVSESGANFLPEARPDMLRGPKRHFTCAPLECMGAAELGRLSAAKVNAVLPRGDDALAVMLYSLPPGGRVAALDPSASAGQFLIVVGGTIRHAGALLKERENLFVSADESGYVLDAGPTGAEVLLLQYPPKEKTYDALQ